MGQLTGTIVVTPADIYKQYNEMKKSLKKVTDRVDLASINRDSIWQSISDIRQKSSRIEKLVLLLAVIQTIAIIIGVQ